MTSHDILRLQNELYAERCACLADTAAANLFEELGKDLRALLERNNAILKEPGSEVIHQSIITALLWTVREETARDQSIKNRCEAIKAMESTLASDL